VADAVVNLADAIDGLRREFTKAIDIGKAEDMQFEVGSVELTVQAAVSTDANGKIGWSVFGIGASHERASTQTLTLKLTPVWKKADGTYEREFTVATQSRAHASFGTERIPGSSGG
jgi:hypothetical protein